MSFFFSSSTRDWVGGRCGDFSFGGEWIPMLWVDVAWRDWIWMVNVRHGSLRNNIEGSCIFREALSRYAPGMVSHAVYTHIELC